MRGFDQAAEVGTTLPLIGCACHNIEQQSSLLSLNSLLIYSNIIDKVQRIFNKENFTIKVFEIF
jgi:hypothetical protein